MGIFILSLLHYGLFGVHLEMQCHFFVVMVIAPAVSHVDGVASLVRNGEQAKTAFPGLHAINALTIWAALEGSLLIERSGTHHRNWSAAARRVIRIGAVIRRQHVRIAVQY